MGIVCGNGNNGGDGAGIARMLKRAWIRCYAMAGARIRSATGRFQDQFRAGQICKDKIYEIIDRPTMPIFLIRVM